jgi:hypothetical protein
LQEEPAGSSTTPYLEKKVAATAQTAADAVAAQNISIKPEESKNVDVDGRQDVYG